MEVAVKIVRDFSMLLVLNLKDQYISAHRVPLEVTWVLIVMSLISVLS